jgi:hypothetical protein
MRNRYPGTCYWCNKKVEPGEGHFERSQIGWRTIHAKPCVFQQRAFKEQARKRYGMKVKF